MSDGPAASGLRPLRLLDEGFGWRVELVQDEQGRKYQLWRPLQVAGAGNQASETLSDDLRAAGELRHRNILQMLAAGVDETSAWILYPHVEGPSLAEFIARGERPAPAEAAATIRNVLAGLAFAHAQGIVHGHLSPVHVRLPPEGEPKVAGFGLRRLSLHDAPEFRAPETRDGRLGTPRSDLFSAGVMLGALLGLPPASSEAPQNPEVPGELLRVVARLSDPDETRRYPDAESAVEDLDAFLAKTPAQKPRGGDVLSGTQVPAEQQKIKSRVPHLTALLVVLIAIFGGLVWGIVRELRQPAEAGEVQVPNVVGEDVDEAVRLVEEAGLQAKTTFERNQDYDADVVFDQEPGGGTQVRAGTVVTLFVSTGADTVVVPDVGGLGLDAARILLLEAELQLSEERRFDPNAPEGEVVEQDPPAGEDVPRGSTVRLVVSAGPEPIEIPALQGKPELEAVVALTRLGFDVAVEREPSDTVQEGVVVASKPPAGRQLNPGEKVTLVVSSGPAPVAVPNVVGLARELAVAALNSAGLNAAVELVPVPFGAGQTGIVLSQFPEPGAEVTRGAVVAVRVSVASPPPTTAPRSTTTTRPPTTTTTRPTTSSTSTSTP